MIILELSGWELTSSPFLQHLGQHILLVATPEVKPPANSLEGAIIGPNSLTSSQSGRDPLLWDPTLLYFIGMDVKLKKENYTLFYD